MWKGVMWQHFCRINSCTSTRNVKFVKIWHLNNKLITQYTVLFETPGPLHNTMFTLAHFCGPGGPSGVLECTLKQTSSNRNS